MKSSPAGSVVTVPFRVQSPVSSEIQSRPSKEKERSVPAAEVRWTSRAPRRRRAVRRTTSWIFVQSTASPPCRSIPSSIPGIEITRAPTRFAERRACVCVMERVVASRTRSAAAIALPTGSGGSSPSVARARISSKTGSVPSPFAAVRNASPTDLVPSSTTTRTFSPARKPALVVSTRRAPSSIAAEKTTDAAYTFRARENRTRVSSEQELNNEGRIAAIRRESLTVAVEALRKLLHEFNARTNARMSAIVSRSGVPVAWVLPDDAQVDNFATMAATLLGALEVMYGTMKMEAPNRITVASDSGILSVHGVTGKMFFVAMAEKQTAAFGKAVAEALGKVKGLLGET